MLLLKQLQKSHGYPNEHLSKLPTRSSLPWVIALSHYPIMISYNPFFITFHLYHCNIIFCSFFSLILLCILFLLLLMWNSPKRFCYQRLFALYTLRHFIESTKKETLYLFIFDWRDTQ